MFYTLSFDDGWWAESMNKFIAMAPCAVGSLPPKDLEMQTVLDDNGEQVIDPITDEPMVTVTMIPYTLAEWRAGPL